MSFSWWRGHNNTYSSYSFFSGSSSSHPKHWLPNTLQVGCTVLTWHQQRITSQSWRRETTAVWSLLMEVEALFLCFPSWEQPLTKRTLFFRRCISCRAKWKADLCSLVKHHLCWHGRADLRRAGGIQQTCMKHNTPLMDICCGSLTPKCQRGYWLPLFFVFFQPWERGDAGSLLESPRSSTWACIIHGLATTRTVKMMPGKTGKLRLWKGWLCVWDLRNSLLKVVFWSGSPALQSVLDLLCRRCSETQENFGRLKFSGAELPVFRGHVHKRPLESNLFLSTQVVEIRADDVFRRTFLTLSIKGGILSAQRRAQTMCWTFYSAQNVFLLKYTHFGLWQTDHSHILKLQSSVDGKKTDSDEWDSKIECVLFFPFFFFGKYPSWMYPSMAAIQNQKSIKTNICFFL